MRITLDQIKRLNFTSEILYDEVYKKQNGHYPVVWNRTIGKYLFEYIEEEDKVRVYKIDELGDTKLINTFKESGSITYLVNRVIQIQEELRCLRNVQDDLFR